MCIPSTVFNGLSVIVLPLLRFQNYELRKASTEPEIATKQSSTDQVFKMFSLGSTVISTDVPRGRSTAERFFIPLRVQPISSTVVVVVR